VFSSKSSPTVNESNTSSPARFNLKQRWKRCSLTKWLVGLLLVLTLALSPAIGLRFALPVNGHEFPHAPYTLITYAFVHLSLGHWLVNSFWIVLLGIIIEPRISTAAFLSLTIISALVGGVTMVLFNPSDATSIFLGSSPIIHGFAGAATLLLVLRFSNFARAELVAVVLVDVLVLTPWVRYLGPTVTTWFVGAMAIFIYSRFADRSAFMSAV